jgi:hypothetical protein
MGSEPAHAAIFLRNLLAKSPQLRYIIAKSMQQLRLLQLNF